MTFKRGQSGNPNGRPLITDDLRDVRLINKRQVELTLSKYMSMDVGEVQKILTRMQADLKTISFVGLSTMEATIITIINKALVDGDHKRLEFLFDRIIGPIEKKVSVVDDRIRDAIPIQLTDVEKLKMLDRYREKILDKNKSEEQLDPATIEAESRDITD